MINKIIISNFKNITHLELDTAVQNFELVAPNKYGKSSIADAIAWVLTGKLLDGSSDIMSIKPKKDTSKLVEVELIFESGTSIKKTYQEKWTRTRGTTDLQLTGHETSCFINGLPEQVSKYDQAILDLFGINFEGKWKGNLILLMIDPLHFGLRLEWKDRRTLVIDLVGDVTDEDVFAKDKSLDPLKPILTKARGKFEDAKKIINNGLKGLKDEESKLKNQIEGFEQIQTVGQKDYEKAKKEIVEINNQVDHLKSKKYQSEEGARAERNNQLASLKERISESKENDFKIYNETFSQRQKELETIRNQKQVVSNDFNKLNNEINRLNNEKANKNFEKERLVNKLKELENEREFLRTKWYNADKSVFHTTDHLNCPNCGFDLNGEMVKEKEEKFNLEKAKTKKEINEQGQLVAKRMQETQAKIVELNDNEEDLYHDLENLNRELLNLSSKLNGLTAEETGLSESIPPFQVSEATKELENQYRELQLKPLETTGTDFSEDINKLIALKEPLQQIIDTYNAEQLTLKRVAQLQVQLEVVINGIADYEHLGALLSEFIKVKLELLNERVEAVFPGIPFQLVESNIKEGSWNEVCWVLDGLVPYHNTNSAAKIELGIKVCEAIRKKLTVKGLPYIIDNAEQKTDRDFTKITEEQTISFVAFDK